MIPCLARWSKPLILKGLGLIEVLAEFYQCGLLLTLITGRGYSKRYQEVLISTTIFLQPLIVRITQPSLYRNSSLPVHSLWWGAQSGQLAASTSHLMEPLLCLRVEEIIPWELRPLNKQTMSQTWKVKFTFGSLRIIRRRATLIFSPWFPVPRRLWGNRHHIRLRGKQLLI